MVLDMTPDGRFRAPRRPSIGLRLIVGSVLLAVVAGATAIMALALWVAMALIPIAIAAAALAYVAIRVRRWRASSALFGGQGGRFGGAPRS